MQLGPDDTLVSEEAGECQGPDGLVVVVELVTAVLLLGVGEDQAQEGAGFRSEEVQPPQVPGVEAVVYQPPCACLLEYR